MKQQTILNVVIYCGLLIAITLPLMVTYDLIYPYVTGKHFTFRFITTVLFSSYLLLMLYVPAYQPKFSWIGVAIVLFVLSIIVSGIMGVLPSRSFYGSYERMDGVITILHLLMLFIVMAHVLTVEKMWFNFFYASIAVATLVALIAVKQHSIGTLEFYNRAYSTLGNPAYLAAYMIFHLFFVALLLTHTKKRALRFLLGTIGLIYLYVLLLTETRGAFLGFIIGTIVSISCIVYFSRHRIILFILPLIKQKKFQRAFFLAGLVAFGLYLTHQPTSSRNSFSAHLRMTSLKQSTKVRLAFWQVALKGWKERPILGYGMNNYSHVIDKHFDPVLHAERLWIDKPHNVILEWLVAGGVVGLLLYLFITGSAINYLCRKKYGTCFSASERAILFGLFTANMIQGLFLFDNIVSYICFFSLLAFIHSRVARPLPHWRVQTKQVTFIALPLLFLMASSLIYFLTLPGFLSAHEAMIAAKAPTLQAQYEKLHQAFERQALGSEELLGLLVKAAASTLSEKDMTPNERAYIIRRTEAELEEKIRQFPLNLRYYFQLANLARDTHDLLFAKEVMAKARPLAPKKQSLILFQGVIELEMGNLDAAHGFFEQAYFLDQSNTEARSLFEDSLSKQKQRERNV